MSSRVCWIFLFFSVVFEVAGTSLMRISQGTSWAFMGMGLMYGFLILSYFCLSKAVLRLPVGVAYAFWEGLGLFLITGIGFFALEERLDAPRLLALALVLGGMLLVHHGTELPKRRRDDTSRGEGNIQGQGKEVFQQGGAL